MVDCLCVYIVQRASALVTALILRLHQHSLPCFQLVFNPAREFDKEFASSKDVQTHFMASAIRLNFLRPSSNSPLSSYYAIADLVIEGHCACFGHADKCSGEVTKYLKLS